MNQLEARLFAACLVDKLGEIRGKKAFQKYVYLAQALGIPMNYSYRMHFYGPFSEELADEFIQDIQKNQVLTISPDNQYIYKPGSNYEVESLRGYQVLKKYQAQLDLFLELFGDKSPSDLELFATIHFICETLEVFYRVNDKPKRLEEIKKAKCPKFSEVKIEHYYDEMVKWNLIN